MASRPVIGSILLKHGAWHWRYYEGGKQLSVKLADYSDECRNKKDVVPLANARAQQLSSVPQPAAGNMTVADFYTNVYLPEIERECAPATVNGYTKLWSTHLQDHFGSTRLADYRPHHAAQFLKGLQVGGMGRHAVSHIRSLMSGIFSTAIEHGKLSLNPIASAGRKKKRSRDGAPAAQKTKAYTMEELLLVLKALQHHHAARLAMALGYFLGLRTAEISGLQWGDISEDWRTISVQRSVWRGKVNPHGKTDTSNAVLPLISPLRELLQQFKAEQTVLEPSQWILVSEARTPLDLHALAKRVIRPTLANAKPAPLPWKGYYAGRRGLATLLANSNPLAAQGMLRHATLNTTQEFYIKAVPAVTVEAMRQLEQNVRDNKGQLLEGEIVSAVFATRRDA